MRDLLLFVNNFYVIARFVRHVFVFLCLLLMLLGLTLAWAEDWTLGDAAYFTLITGLTVGYGDMTPVTTLGRIASIASAIIGVGATGLYVAIASKAVATATRGQRFSRDIKIADADVD
jgi:voltage-gated potassium channel